MGTFESEEHKHWKDINNDIFEGKRSITLALASCRGREKYAKLAVKLEQAEILLKGAEALISEIEDSVDTDPGT